jgi:hypothetical protein
VEWIVGGVGGQFYVEGLWQMLIGSRDIGGSAAMEAARVASAKRVRLLNSLLSQLSEMSTRCVQDTARYSKVYNDELGLDQILFGLFPSLSFGNEAGRGELMN